MVWFFALLLGIVSGFVVNYLADVLPHTRSFSQPVCLKCSQAFSWRDYLLLRPCPACHASRSKRTFVIQIGLPVLATLMGIFPPGRPGTWVGIVLMTFFALVAVMDLEYRVVLHPVSIAGAVLGLAFGFWKNGLLTTLIGGAVGFGVMYLFYLFGILFNRWMAKVRKMEIDEVALGFGDVNIGGVLGLMVGFTEILGVLMVAFLAGGLVSGAIMLWMALRKRYQPLMAIPYAPFLLLGAIIFIYIPQQ